MRGENENTRPPATGRDNKIISICTQFAWFCVILGFVAAAFGFCKIGIGSPGDLSALGSYLQGAVVSLWSLAAFLFIYVAFLGQKQQLLLQQRQLEDQGKQSEEQNIAQQKQLDTQAKQFQEQQSSIKRQNFENSFFQLLGLHNQVVAQMRHGITQKQWDIAQVTYKPASVEGRECFIHWFKSFANVYQAQASQRKKLSKPEAPAKQHITEAYVEFYKTGQKDLGHYFRTLYHLIKFVKYSDAIKDEEKRRYTSLVRAQLSAYELLLLFYNCLSPYGDKFKPLVEEFGLLEHLEMQVDRTMLLDRAHLQFYLSSAYK